MDTITNLTPAQLRHAADIQEQIQDLQAQLSNLLQGVPERSAPPASKTGARGGKRRLSPEGLANIRAGVAKRMAAQQRSNGTVTKTAKQPRRQMSPAAKARLAAIARARWKQAKAQGKSRL